MVGKYVNLRDSYISLSEALTHAGVRTRTRVNIQFVEATDVEKHGTGCLEGVDAILVPGGFGERGIEGKIQAIRYAREHQHPVPRHLPRHAARRSSSTRATSRAWRARIAPSSIARRRIR